MFVISIMKKKKTPTQVYALLKLERKSYVDDVS